jgi:hypothetical protein
MPIVEKTKDYLESYFDLYFKYRSFGCQFKVTSCYFGAKLNDYF